MPIYEYKCQKCGHQFDLIQKMNEEPAKQCPKCYQNSLEKMVSAPGFQLKGGGWYETDFKTKSKPVDSKQESTSPAKDTSSKKGDDL